MSNIRDEDKGALGRRPGTLSMSAGKSGGPRRNMGGTRGPVVVETKKRKRILNPNAPQPAPVAPPKAPPAAPVQDTAKKTVEETKPAAKASATPGGLSGDEQARRLKAVVEEKERSVERAAREEEDRKRREEEDERHRRAKEIEAKKKAAEEAEAATSGDDRLEAERKRNKVKPRQAAAAQASAKAALMGETAAPGKKVLKPVERRDRGDDRTKKTKADRQRQNDGRMRGRLTINNALNENQRQRSLASLKRKREREKSKAAGLSQPKEKITREVIVPEVITIQELANRMAERAVDVIKYLMKEGQMHQINDVIEGDTAELIVAEFGHTVKRVSEADVEQGFIGLEDDEGDLKSRAPVVTVMGHVDHGKTSLLDALRKAKVVAGEAGGITQHIGAYQVEGSSGKVTFIDTPGHAAFTAMRARGAQVTDIVILVVAGDDGVMPQTIEAINHAKAAEVPLIVAINKMDKPSADPQRVRTELLQHEVIVESMSGETLEVEVSALKGDGLDNLLEAIHMQAEIMDLKANPDRNAEGVVVEAKLERGRGPVGTVLIQRGRIAVGNIVVAGKAWGRVRALINDKGENVPSAGPSEPVEVLGFNSAPEAGDQFAVVENEARAREITDYRIRKRREVRAAGAGSVRSLEAMMNQLQQEGIKEFPLLIKGDVQGSIEAINAALEKLGNEEVAAKVIHSAVGGITESDITLANASNAAIIGFNVRANMQAKQAAHDHGLEIRYYSVIYDLVDDVKAAMSGMLDPELKEHFLGNAEILDVFHISGVGKVAGCRVTEGKIERGAGVRLIRDNVVIHEGKLITLKRFKDEVKEVQTGQECGMAFENYQDLKADDIIEAFHVETIERSL